MIRITIALAIAVILNIGAIAYAQPGAAGGGPHPVCIAWVAQCAKGPCPPPPPCQELNCNGICAGVMCRGLGCSQGDGTTDSTAGGLGALQDLIGKVLQGLGGGGGGGGGMPPPPGFDPALFGQQQPDPNTTGALFDAANNVSGGNGTVNELKAATDNSQNRVNALLNAFDEKKSTDQAPGTGSTTESGGSGVGNTSGTEPTQYESVADKVRKQAQVSAEEEARAKREAEERLAAEEARDAARGGITGIIDDLLESGRQLFDGQLFATRSTFLLRLCTGRPWESSFLAQFFPNTFFQTLCARRGVEVAPPPITTQAGSALLTCSPEVTIGEPAFIEWDCDGSTSSSDDIETGGVASGSIQFVPEDSKTYRLACGNGGVTSCAINVKKPRVQLIAYPERVPLGARAKIYWVSEHADECVVRGPNFEEAGVRGVATTAAILDQVTFTAVCTKGVYSAEETIVVDVGE